MISNKHGRVRTNYLSNVRGIQNNVSRTIYRSQSIGNDGKKIVKSKTEKNENIEIRN